LIDSSNLSLSYRLRIGEMQINYRKYIRNAGREAFALPGTVAEDASLYNWPNAGCKS
jgi:hypothetical protein